MAKFYTFQIVLNRREEGTDVNEAHEFRDCTAERIVQLTNEVWARGIVVSTSPTCREVISPFAIKQVFIITQDKQYNPDI